MIANQVLGSWVRDRELQLRFIVGKEAGKKGLEFTTQATIPCTPRFALQGQTGASSNEPSEGFEDDDRSSKQIKDNFADVLSFRAANLKSMEGERQSGTLDAG